MTVDLTAELDAIAEQRAAGHAARAEQLRALRAELAECRAAGKRIRHARRLARIRPAGKRVRPVRNPLPARVPPGSIYVGRAGWGLRGSPYANPHKPAARTVEAHLAAVAAYRRWLRGRPDLVAGIRRDFADGQDAACWCRQDLPCHADVILAVARGGSP